MDELNNSQAEDLESASKIEKVDMSAIKIERDKQEFNDKIESLLGDYLFMKNCDKYLKIKDKNN